MLHRVSTADNMVLGIPRKASESGSASCAVNKIREAFPSNEYIGFKYPHSPR